VGGELLAGCSKEVTRFKVKLMCLGVRGGLGITSLGRVGGQVLLVEDMFFYLARLHQQQMFRFKENLFFLHLTT
jgi:hypothetical protein